MLPHLNSSPDFVRMFVDEARLGARLEHPNIVRTYEFGETDGQYFTVMEYLPGEDIGRVLNRLASKQQQMPMNLAVYVVLHACCGLHFAHELTDDSGAPLGLVHRDVNPSNIIVTYGGEVKVIDFGVAKASTNSSQTLAGTIKGKLAYMSPEQVRAESLDRRADVFSVGVVLWELLGGRPLFSRDNEAATLHAILHDPIPSIRQLRPDVPRELDAMVQRALARNPSDRFESCELMQFALESFLGTQPKIDRRALAATMESIFGKERARAKLSIAQNRSLTKNVSLVMKVRTDVKRSVVSTGDRAAATSSPALPEAPANRKVSGGVVALLGLGLIGGGFFYLNRGSNARPESRHEAVQHSSIDLTSTPSGAAVFVANEPTGLTTPTKLTGLTPGTVAIRLELAGYEPVVERVNAQPGATVARTIALKQLLGRLILTELPNTATVWIDDEETILGEVITLPVGSHDVRIDIEGKPFVRQRIQTTTGDQVWQLHDDRLVAEAKE
jgi:serine/threonine protein kinase